MDSGGDETGVSSPPLFHLHQRSLLTPVSALTLSLISLMSHAKQSDVNLLCDNEYAYALKTIIFADMSHGRPL